MDYPPLLRQPKWVLQRGSSDRQGPDHLSANPDENAIHAWSLIRPGWDAFRLGDMKQAKQLWRRAAAKEPHNLLLMRTLNQYAPELLVQTRISRMYGNWGNRIAVVIPGELRCYSHSMEFIKALCRQTDVFICTSQEFSNAAKCLKATEVEVLQQEPDLPIGAMHQWHKLAVALSMVRSREKRTRRRYTHIIKLRSDFYHVQPSHLLNELVSADALICSSDKVFGGRRDLMMLFEGFYEAIYGWFDQKEQHYWPVNVRTILDSDDSCKWYGMNFPKELVGQPSTVEELRTVLRTGGKKLAKDLQQWKLNNASDAIQLYSEQFLRLLPGNLFCLRNMLCTIFKLKWSQDTK